VIRDILFGLPISYLLALANKFTITSLGYEKLMRCSGGIFVNRILFITVNLCLIYGWATQLGEKVKQEERERLDRDIN